MKRVHIIILTLLMIVMTPLTALGEGNGDHRALLIGNSAYYDGNTSLEGPINDLIKMESTMRNNYFGDSNKPFKSIVVKKNQTSAGIIQSIQTAFKDAKANDVSYIYYSGHGYLSNYTGVSNLAGVDGSSLDVNELERALAMVPGKVVVILDSCNSGGFINRSTEAQQLNTDLDQNKEYNSSVIEAFTNSKSRGYLTEEKYKVITASSKTQNSYEYGYPDGWGGGFTRAFVEGSGFKGSFLSDANSDGDVSLSEIYQYTKGLVHGSSVQVYPQNDTFVIASNLKDIVNNDTQPVDPPVTPPTSTTLNWKESHDVKLDKAWTVTFNANVRDSSWYDKVYVSDEYGNIVDTIVSKNPDGKSLTVTPVNNYNPGSKYSLWISDNIHSEAGVKNKNQILMNFYTGGQVIPQEPVYPDYTGDSIINLVKGWSFYSYPYPSVGEAFDNFFEYPAWRYFESTDDLDIVEFTGTAIRNGIDVEVLIQFSVDIYNEVFEIAYAEYFDGYDEYEMYDDDFDDLLNTIYTVYHNPRLSKDLENDLTNPASNKEQYNFSDKKLKK